MVDYVIVGSGLAGISFAETLLSNNKSFFVFENYSQNSSVVAAGLYNPVILKRFSEVWNAKTQLDFAAQFYSSIEKKLALHFDYKLPIYRKFFSVEEQNNWFAASENPKLSDFLSTSIITKEIQGLRAPYGYGQVLTTGFVSTSTLLKKYHNYLKSLDLFFTTFFDYAQLVFFEDHIQYQTIKAKHIIFAEGFGLHSNPYFNYLPLDGTKGELLTIKAPKLKLDVILNTSIYIIPLGDSMFKVGATYNWEDKTNCPSAQGKSELINKLKVILTCDFEVLEHLAGVRPTVRDRKPLLGTHPTYKNAHILNGLGTRGVMLAPSMALDLFNFIEHGIPLDETIDIKRYPIF